MGPIAVAPHLVPFLPGHPVTGAGPLPPVSAAPWGSASILLVSHAYACLLGAEGMTAATQVALLNANYLKDILSQIDADTVELHLADAGAPTLISRRRLTADHQIEQVGAKLRAMMPWIAKNKLVDQSKN